MIDIKAILRQLATGVSQRQVDWTVYKYFKEYLDTDRNKDPYFDCSEVSDDFLEHKTKGATIYNIKPTNKTFMTWFEFYKPTEITYHYVYVSNGVAYDPRLHTEPILWVDYVKLINQVNQAKGVTLTYEVEFEYN